MIQLQPKPYTTHQGCRVQTRFEYRENGTVHEIVTLTGTSKVASVFRDTRARR